MNSFLIIVPLYRTQAVVQGAGQDHPRLQASGDGSRSWVYCGPEALLL